MTSLRLLVVLLPALCCLVFAGGAGANTTIIEPPESHYPYQQWADEAKMPTPNVPVQIIEMSGTDPAWPCKTEYGYEPEACVLSLTGEIFLDTARLVQPRRVVYHELGHIFDARALTDADRERFATLIEFPAEPWLSSAYHGTAGEIFAEAYAECASVGARIGTFNGMIVPPHRLIGKRLHFQLCTLIERAARRS